ncbi:hypothetical protein IEQ34_013149 [Dendrobium chrysotoxum]|uniref:Ninja-family protein n=1 Tax=Dendrobium chrysotoxum TaxID=161865 RepID=A0AAV7GQV0_DENCH|nr:hypothetical protein IEQ34_013149 [Dendrobium chrysotoxum]
MDIEVREVEVEELPCPRDLLRRLAGTSCSENHVFASSDCALLSAPASSEMDLCLGLSLGGCFAVERSDKRLVRSSSIAALSIFPTEKDFPPAAAPLARTCSLPVEADEENRKRKEMQSLKRLEAKRKREEKRSFSRPGVDGELYVGVPPRGSGPRPVLSPAMLAGMRRSSSTFDTGGSRVPDIPESHNNNKNAAVGNNSSFPSTSDTIDKPETTTHPASALRSLRSLGEDDEAMKRMMSQVSKDMKTNIMEEMPCVSTKGDGPNGKRIEGFLYRYKKGEDVSIVCVCHGSFLTPAEFIKHAGGGDVDHPLRHIVVNPSTSLPPYY